MSTNKIETLKAYAQANYEEGMDSFIECYSDDEWLELLNSHNNCVKAAKADMRQVAGIHLERQANARNSAF